MQTESNETRLNARLRLVEEHVRFENLHDLDGILGTFGKEARYDDEPWDDHRIGRGEAILSYLEMGASGVQLGTRFVCARESIAHRRFKQAFLRAGARDAVPSVQIDPRFPVIPVRALANEGTQAFADCQRGVIDRFNALP